MSAPGRPSVLQRHKLIGKIASLFFQLSGNIDIMISAFMSNKIYSFSKQSPKAQLFCWRNICQGSDLLQLCSHHSWKVSFVFVPSQEMVPQKRRKRGALRRQKRASFNFKNWFHNHIDLSPSRLTQIGTGMGITTSSSLSQLGSIPPTHLKTKKRDQNLAIWDLKKWHDYNCDVYTFKGCVGLKYINLGGFREQCRVEN